MTSKKKPTARRKSPARRNPPSAHGASAFAPPRRATADRPEGRPPARRARRKARTKAAPAREPAPAKNPVLKPPDPEAAARGGLLLRKVRKVLDKFKRELRLPDDGVADPYLRERLFSDLALSFLYEGAQDTDAFLKNAREQRKVVGKTASTAESKNAPIRAKRNPGKDLEQIYGPGVVVVEGAAGE